MANRRDLPSAVDLDALNSKPFKDATQADSIRKLEQRLEGVASKGDHLPLVKLHPIPLIWTSDIKSVS